jgi:hypothetical protein
VSITTLIWRRFPMHAILLPASLVLLMTGSKIVIRIAMIPITTTSSTSENAGEPAIRERLRPAELLTLMLIYVHPLLQDGQLQPRAI